jgi:8-oxo-dGTP pyrophosphatase MutT (NUDIX family)
MNRLVSNFGRIVYFIGMPFWYIYFRLSPVRSRIIVVCGNEVLMVKGWLGPGLWTLPGGGVKKNELLEVAARRELKEEVGIEEPESSLRLIGSYRHNGKVIKYKAEIMVLELGKKPVLRRQKLEIAEAKWFGISEIRGNMLDKDAAFGLKKYLPEGHTSLL